MAGRRLTDREVALARSVFGDAVRLERVRLHGGGFGPFAVTLGRRIFLPAVLARLDYGRAGVADQALLVHELVHVWQFQNRPFRTLASWAFTAASGGYGPGLPGYRYTLPLTPFERLGLERQARVVEHAFLLARGARTRSMPPGLSIDHLAEATPFRISA